MQWYLPDESSTLSAGSSLGSLIQTLDLYQPPGFQIWLNGDLGAGKTTLVRGVLSALGYEGRVKSPTYPLLETYNVGSIAIAHFDLYRLESPAAFVEAGFEEVMIGSGVRFVEWPDRACGQLPNPDWCLTLEFAATNGRQMRIDTLSDRGKEALAAYMP